MASRRTLSGARAWWAAALLGCGGCAAGAHGGHGVAARHTTPRGVACGATAGTAPSASVSSAGSASTPALAAASGARSEAARAFDDGVAAYRRGAYEQAARSFERAYRLRPTPVVLFNLARSYERAGQAERAADTYVAYLRADRNAPPERQRAAGEALARLR